MRQGFSSRLGFILAAAGSAVGLGNIWGFPTQVANHGGGAFILMYLVVLLLFALPALYAELNIGFTYRANPVTAMTQAWRRSPILGPVAGLANVIGAMMMLGFYSILAGWMLAHSIASFLNLLNQSEAVHFLTDNTLARNMISTITVISLTALIIVGGVRHGIEKWSKRLMPVLLLLMCGLIIYIFTLPGAMEGLSRFLIPDYSALTNPDLLIAAMGQAFFSLSVGVGGMMVYGSYLNQKENLPKLSLSIASLDTLIAFLAGLLVIPALFVAQSYGSTISQDGELIGRSQLIFTVLPELFDGLDLMGSLLGFGFFTLLSIASLTSTIASTEVPVSYLTEKHNLSRKQAVIGLSLAVLLLSSIIIVNFDSLFRTVIVVLTHYMLPAMGLVYFITVGWIMPSPLDPDNASRWQRWFFFHLKYVCPVLMLLVFWHVATQ